MISLTRITTRDFVCGDNYDSSSTLMMGTVVNYIFPTTFREEKLKFLAKKKSLVIIHLNLTTLIYAGEERKSIPK